MLMENGPSPDFEMNFYAGGTKILISLLKNEIIIKKYSEANDGIEKAPMEIVKFKTVYPDQEQLTAVQYQQIKHAQDCLKQCKEIEDSAKHDLLAKYPIILKSSTCTNVSPGRNRSISPSPSIHPSVISSYSAVSNRHHSRKSTTGIILWVKHRHDI
jgi:hypothetical protein